MLLSDKVNIANKKVRLMFYTGVLLPVCLLSLTITAAHVHTMDYELKRSLDQLEAKVLEEKKQFLKSAIERTIYMIEHMRRQTRQELDGKGYTQQELDGVNISKIKGLIRDIRLSKNNEYIWVNQVINFEGGDNYAFRAIHPNLPHTEGMMLSTNLTDIKGNRPYEEELNGIKNYGELFFSYYFKSINSDKMIKKLSYAKLYEPYNWIIATGLNLDNLEAYINNEKQSINDTYVEHKHFTYIFSVLIIGCAFSITLIFEKLVRNMLRRYDSDISLCNSDLKKKSTTYELAGSDNRDYFMANIEKMIQHSERYGRDFSITLVSIDCINTIKATYGNQAKEQAIKELYSLIKSNARVVDTVGRLNDSEFMIVSPEIIRVDAEKMSARLKNIIESHEFQVVKGLYISYGVSCYRQNDTVESITSRVSKALARHMDSKSI